MRLLDTFCKAGGAAMGYHRADFEVVGVDIEPQPHYPFEFHQADALEYIRDHGHEFDVIHASPPCQAFSHATHEARSRGVQYPDLLTPTRKLLKGIPVPYVIENVPGSPMSPTIILCGLTFGLHVFRHRWFECSDLIIQPEHLSHLGKQVGQGYFTVFGTGGGRCRAGGRFTSGHRGNKRDWSNAMGIEWMTKAELTQAIPPAYTEYIGRQIMDRIQK